MTTDGALGAVVCQPSCSDSVFACQAPLRCISPITSSVSVTSVTNTSAPFARSMTASDGVAGEQERTIRCIEAVGERFVLAVGRRARLESEVSVLDRRHLDVGTLIDDASRDVV